MLEENQLAVCAPVKLELLYSARDAADYEWLEEGLRGFPHLPLDERIEDAALRAQRALTERGQHRGPTPTDLLIAAVAEVHEVTLLHYDRHFDLIVRATGQKAEWLAPRGSLG